MHELTRKIQRLVEIRVTRGGKLTACQTDHANYQRAFIEKGELNELEEQGLIQACEYTYGLVWNTLKDYFEAQGETAIHDNRDAFRLAFRRGLIEDIEDYGLLRATREGETTANVARETIFDIINT